MKSFIRGRIVTGVVVFSTLILAGVAIFTALRLYRLRQESISPKAPESEPSAWDCSSYVFSVSSTGTVSVVNNSTRSESPQQAKVYINGNLINTFAVPALARGQNATLGTVKIPSGQVSWEVVGSSDCRNSGQLSSEKPSACKSLTFSLTAVTSTLTVSPAFTATPKLSNTPTPTGEITASNTPTTAVNSSTPTPNNTNSPTATSAITQFVSSPTHIAQTTQSGGVGGAGGENLPAAGYGLPTIITIGLGLLLVTGALLLLAL